MKLNRPIIYIILFALAILLFNIFSNPRLDGDKIVKISFSASSNKYPLLTDDFLATNPYFILNKKEYRYNPATKQLTIIWRGELDIHQVSLVKCYQELCVFRKD